MSDFERLLTEKLETEIFNILIFDSEYFENDKYNGYYHAQTKKASRQIGEQLRKHLIFYALGEKEFDDLYKNGRLRDIEKEVKTIKNNRLPKRKGATNGIYSETLLDLFLYILFPTIKKACIKPIHRQRTDNQELKGFDSYHMVIDGDNKYLILGQAKLGDRYYCIKDIESDLKKVEFLYTYDELFFISDKRESLVIEVKQILLSLNNKLFEDSGLNNEQKKESIKYYFEENNIKIIMPCLLSYPKPSIYDENFETKYIIEMEDIKKSVEDFAVKLEWDIRIVFIFFPIESSKELRKGMNFDEI